MMLHFVRHTEVCASAKGLCYGVSDMPLVSAPPPDLIARLRALEPELIVSSDLSRGAELACAVASNTIPLRLDPRWRERDFGSWEARPWDDIHAEDGSAIARLMEPDFAPPGGESLRALETRIRAALSELPRARSALIVAHGGPIAAARLILSSLPLSDVSRLIPAPGGLVSVERAEYTFP